MDMPRRRKVRYVRVGEGVGGWWWWWLWWLGEREEEEGRGA